MQGRAGVAYADCQHKLGQLDGALESLETFLQLSHSQVRWLQVSVIVAFLTMAYDTGRTGITCGRPHVIRQPVDRASAIANACVAVADTTCSAATGPGLSLMWGHCCFAGTAWAGHSLL
jgi:hypothetical protein